MSHANWAMLEPRDGVDAYEDNIYDEYEARVAGDFNHSRLFLKITPPTNLAGQVADPVLWCRAGFKGQWLRIDCLGGHAERQIKRVMGYVIELHGPPLTTLPLPGGVVKLIHGRSQSYIDLRLRDHMEKNKLKLLKNGVFIRL